MLDTQFICPSWLDKPYLKFMGKHINYLCHLHLNSFLNQHHDICTKVSTLKFLKKYVGSIKKSNVSIKTAVSKIKGEFLILKVDWFLNFSFDMNNFHFSFFFNWFLLLDLPFLGKHTFDSIFFCHLFCPCPFLGCAVINFMWYFF